VASQARSTYVVTNNHFEGKAVVNGLQLIHLLFGDLVETPPDLLNAYPELALISRNAPLQRNLFGPLATPPRMAGQPQASYKPRNACAG
jgi:hypothetical protein